MADILGRKKVRGFFPVFRDFPRFFVIFAGYFWSDTLLSLDKVDLLEKTNILVN